MIDKNKIIKELDLRPFGRKGWLKNINIECPECNDSEKFGISLGEKHGAVHCFKCDYSVNIYKFLHLISRADLISGNESVEFGRKLVFIDEEKENEGLQTIKPPVGFKRIYFDEYLDDRGFTEYQYELFNVGTSTLPGLKGYLVFLLYDRGELIAYLARSKRDKEWHKENLRKYKLGRGSLVLRYRNSDDTEFGLILGGIDEITEEVTTVIAVEGLFDKSNTDRELDLYSNRSMKCVYTFGNKFSEEQIARLKETNVKNVILLYDYNTIQQSKSSSLYLGKHFNVKVGEILEDTDPGEMYKEELLKVFKNMKSPINFFSKRLKLNKNF